MMCQFPFLVKLFIYLQYLQVFPHKVTYKQVYLFSMNLDSSYRMYNNNIMFIIIFITLSVVRVFTSRSIKIGSLLISFTVDLYQHRPNL